MKTTKNKRDFNAVKFMREQRDRISKDISKMSFEEIKQYLAKSRTDERVLPCREK